MRRSGVFCNQVSTNTPLATTLTVLEATDEALCSQHERATRVPIPSPVSALSGTPVCFALTSAVTTISRMLVHESVQAELLDILCERTAAIKIGDPLLPDTLLGPLVSEASTHNRRHHYTGARCTVHSAHLAVFQTIEVPHRLVLLGAHTLTQGKTLTLGNNCTAQSACLRGRQCLFIF